MTDLSKPLETLKHFFIFSFFIAKNHLYSSSKELLKLMFDYLSGR